MKESILTRLNAIFQVLNTIHVTGRNDIKNLSVIFDALEGIYNELSNCNIEKVESENTSEK